MASNTYGAIKLSTAEDVGAVLKKKTGSADGYKPKEWADTINLLGLLPIRTASGTIAHFEDGADVVPMKSVVANIVPIQSGSGTPSPSNPRPISGTNELTLTRTGANLFDKTNEGEQINGYISASKIVADNNSLTVFTKCNPNTTYTVSKTAGKRFIVCWFDSVPNVGDTLSGQTIDQQASSITITTGATAKYIVAFVFNASVDTTITRAEMLDSIQIEEGSTATTYEPYTAETYTIDLGQEIMGGSADVVGGTGSKTMAKIDLGDLTWTKQTMQNGSGFTARIEDGEPIGNVSSSGALCEIYPEDISVQNPYYIADETFKYGGTYFGRRNVTILDSTKENMTASEFKTAMAGIKFAYPLETPTDFTFTGQQINSYLGVNNVWTDSGEVLDVEYRADMNLLIAELGG